MADIGIDLKLTCDDCGNTVRHRGVIMEIAVARIAVYQCEVCIRAAQEEHAKLETEVRELKRYKARMDWLHAGGGETDRDAEGYEWGVARVKFNVYGQPVSVLWTDSDHRDLDAEMERTKTQNST